MSSNQDVTASDRYYTVHRNGTVLENATNVTAPFVGEEAFEHAPTYIFVLVTFFNIIIFVAGIVGNLFVILAVCRVRFMRTATNYFLLTLSVADLLVLIICQPVAVMEFYAKERWLIGDTMCKIVPFLENSMVHVSVLTVVAMTMERYHSILYPLRRMANSSSKTTILIICSLWLFAFVWTVPFLIFSRQEDAIFYDGSDIKVCRTNIAEFWQIIYVLVNNVVFFLTPLCIVTVMYARICLHLVADSSLTSIGNVGNAHHKIRQRKQVVRMLIFIIVLFFVSICPFRAITLWQIFAPVESLERLGIEAYYNIIWFARIMTYINSAGNPIIYAFTSSKFKMAFKLILGRGLASSQDSARTRVRLS